MKRNQQARRPEIRPERFRYLGLTTTLLTLITLGCHGDEVLRPPCEFSGISTANETGDVTDADPDDWCPAASDTTRVNAFWPAYPNPSDGVARIRYSLAEDNQAVKLYVLDANCETVRTLVDRVQSGAEHEVFWNGTNDDSLSLPRGLYRVILELDDFQCHGDIDFQPPPGAPM